MRKLTIALCMALLGCGGDDEPTICDDAVARCEACEVDGTGCEKIYSGASDEFCEQAVAVYRASCSQ